MTFYSFAASMYLYRFFKRHAIENPMFLNENEFLLHLDDPLFCKQLLYSVDSFYNPTEQEVISSTGNTNPSNLTESDFFITFMQYNQKTIKHQKKKYKNRKEDPPFIESGLHDTEANPINRKLVYKMFQRYDQPRMTLSNFILFYKLSYYFINFDTNY